MVCKRCRLGVVVALIDTRSVHVNSVAATESVRVVALVCSVGDWLWNVGVVCVASWKWSSGLRSSVFEVLKLC